jgi:hypothetical protein
LSRIVLYGLNVSVSLVGIITHHGSANESTAIHNLRRRRQRNRHRYETYQDPSFCRSSSAPH